MNAPMEIARQSVAGSAEVFNLKSLLCDKQFLEQFLSRLSQSKPTHLTDPAHGDIDCPPLLKPIACI